MKTVVNFLKIVFGVILLSSVLFLSSSISVFPITLAEDDSTLQVSHFNTGTKIWDFLNPGEYIYDQTKIEISGGEASLRANPPANWYNPAWNYRRLITINNSLSEQDLANFQVEVKLDSSNFDFSKTKADGADIRFTASDGMTPLDYWIEHYDSVNEEAFLFVEIPALWAFSDETIYMYYGNPAANTASSWNNVFTSGPAGPEIEPVFNGGFNAFPGLTRLSSGELLISFRSGSAHISPDGQIVLGRSLNGGESWSSAVIYDDPTIDDRVDLGLTKLSDGTLIQPFYQHNGTTTVAAFVIKSSNNGLTWSAPINIRTGALSNWAWLATYGQIIELADDVLLMPVYGVYENEERMRSLFLQSIDRGETWFLKSVIASGGASYNEASVLRLDEQNYLAIVRREDVPARLYKVVSYDGGNTWSEPVYLFEAAAPNLLRLASGNILLATSDRSGIKGIRVSISKDLGETWEDSVLIDKEYLIRDLGYPATYELQTRPSEIMTVYYKEGQGIKQAIYSEEFVAANPNFTNFFDGLEGNELENREIWRLEGGLNMINATTSIKRSGSKSLFIQDNSGISDIFATRVLAPFPKNHGSVSFWVYPQTTINGFEFGLLSDGTTFPLNKVFWFRIAPDGSLSYQTHAGAIPCAGWRSLSAVSVEIGKWSKINLNFNGNSSAVDVYVNGLNIGIAGACSASTNIFYLGFSTASQVGIGDLVYFDDIYTRQYSLFSQIVSVGQEEGMYALDNPWVRPVSQNLGTIRLIYSLSETAVKNGGEIKYQFSNDGGNSWYRWNGSAWAIATNGYEETNVASELIGSRLLRFPVGNGDIVFRAFLHSNGSHDVRLDKVEIKYMISGGFRHPVPTAD